MPQINLRDSNLNLKSKTRLITKSFLHCNEKKAEPQHIEIVLDNKRRWCCCCYAMTIAMERTRILLLLLFCFAVFAGRCISDLSYFFAAICSDLSLKYSELSSCLAAFFPGIHQIHSHLLTKFHFHSSNE